MKFQFKIEDFEEMNEYYRELAAILANRRLNQVMGRYELFLTSEQHNKFTADTIDIEPFIEHSYKPK